MSRRALAIVVGIVGFLLAGGSLIALMIAGSLFADARSANITGPGVDVFLVTPFPGPTDEIVLEVEARGGERAGIGMIIVRDPAGYDTAYATVHGEGATWGSTISKSKGRGSEAMTVRFRPPPGTAAGDTLALAIDVAYVVAMSEGSSFSNEPKHDVVRLDLPILSESGRTFARFRRVALAIGLFALWLLVVWGVALLYARAEDRGGSGGGDAEAEGIGLLMGIMGGGIAGYWLFARRVMSAMETDGTGWAVLFTALWIVLPLAWVWWWRKHRRAIGVWRCEVPAIPGARIDGAQLGSWLIEHQRIVRRRDRHRWTATPVAVADLVLASPDDHLLLVIAHRIARHVGAVVVLVSPGERIEIDPAKTIEDIERARMAAMMAQAQAMLGRMNELQALLEKGKQRG